ncbi:hypothetical protein E4O92_09900 [Massilia horti]|uniref:Uncharacterized protein n=2 Tax=Massilia horti TaxID=2562153 RepID=A0A4Y9T352_9BURK|nr:hypothetical protein E4O92_09900 [Massilia horti]
MVLAEDLLDRQGQMLLPKGAVLAAGMLASLARHGIAMLPIAVAEPAEARDDAAIQARLDHIFRKHDREDNNDWATTLLRRHIEGYRLTPEVAPEVAP